MSKRTQRKQSIFSAGRVARKNGLSDKINPYKKDRGVQTIWHAGWKHEEEISEKRRKNNT